jgi:flagellin
VFSYENYLEIEMPTVNSNTAAQFALNKMTNTEREMTTAMERLSSGKRINHAGDDAAGAAIADRMTAQIKGLEQSVRNAADVISMAQVTEGALDESSAIIQRIRELAIQSASDVMNAEERSYLDAEVVQMLAELDRVTRDTTFNEIAVLDGSFADRRFQIGTHEREFAQLSISSMRLDSLGAYKAKSQGTETTDIANSAVDNDNLALNAYAVGETSEANLIQSETFTIHGILGSSTITAAEGSTVRDISTSVNAVFDSTGVTSIASTQLKLQAKTLDKAYNGQTSVSFSIQGKNTTAVTIAANLTLSNNEGSSILSEVRDSINNYSTTTGVTATLSTDKSSIIMVQNEGYDIKLGDVNFAGDTTTTGSRRTLLVTSLDNDEVVAGDAVSLGDTNVTTTDDDGIYTGTPTNQLTIGGRIGTTNPTAFPAAGPVSTATNATSIVASQTIAAADDDRIVTSQGITSGFTGTQSLTMINTSAVHNSFVTITASAACGSFKVVGTDIFGNALEETITAFTGGATKQTTNRFATVTSVIPSGNDADANIKVGTLEAIMTMVNTATVHNSIVTITSNAATDGTFLVTGTDVYGNSLQETVPVFSGGATQQTTNVFGTVTSVIPSAVDGDATVSVGVLNTIANQSALITITSSASDESDKTFTVTGTDMSGNTLVEVITGPEANKTVTGRRIFKTIHTVVNSGATTGAIKIGLKAADSVIVTGQLEMSSSNSFTVVGEDGKGLFEASPGAASLDKLSGVNVKTRQSSIDALRVLDRSLDRIHKERAKLGALMSRMEKAINNLSNVALNTNASRGRIEDADFAKESARLTRAQILQQSAMAMIAQAGKAQQNVLQLLQQ